MAMVMQDFPVMCRHCETYECLEAPEMPQDALDELESVWREECEMVVSLERNPSAYQKVRHLQVVEPEKMADFFQTHCDDR